MAVSPPAYAFVLAVFLLLVASVSGGNRKEGNKGNDFCFSFDGSEKNRSFGSEFALHGDAEMSGLAARMTRPAKWSSGRIAYRKAVRIFGAKPGFSTSFSFSIPPDVRGGLAFFLSPSAVRLEPAEGEWLGLSTSLLAVRFGTPKDDKFGNRSRRSLIEVDVGGELLTKSSNLSDVESTLKSGKKLRSWIDYDGDSKRIEVRLMHDNDSRPVNFSISYSTNLSNLLRREAMFVGLSSWNGNSTKTSSIYSWNFTVKHGAPYLMHSEPLDPNSFLVRPTESPPVHPSSAYPWGVLMAMVFAAACGALLTFFMILVWVRLVSRRPVAPVESPVLPMDVAYGKIESVGDKDLENSKK
ncbi:hypothetical protein Cni_G13442 [Canna indica]|uniref:Legume lectin domain-containing protein n=1 Tax=Canna indica TaxID=4628 RepID=A0AAQ3KA40_9LILI|nr:hypothetical protein Cni_G13442 [Canna indica]